MFHGILKEDYLFETSEILLDSLFPFLSHKAHKPLLNFPSSCELVLQLEMGCRNTLVFLLL